MKWKLFCVIFIVLHVEASNRLKYIRNLQWRINGFHSRLFAPTWLFQKEGFIKKDLCNFIQSLFHLDQVSTYKTLEFSKWAQNFWLQKIRKKRFNELVNVMIAAGPYFFIAENEKCNNLRNAFVGRVRGLGS